MTCWGPRTAYYSNVVNPSGKRSLVWDKRKSHTGIALRVPCGECSGCAADKARSWAVRCMHEKRMHRLSAFVTLTYDHDHLPPDGSLSLRHLQLFMKRLRESRSPGLRFFACGEYGETFHRPHYHILLFNTDFPDQRPSRLSKTGDQLYCSAELSGLWKDGAHQIGAVTFASAAYVARYCTVKARALPGVAPEFQVMSRRPGLGSSWLDAYSREAYQADSAVMAGREVPLPRYYDVKFRERASREEILDLERRRRRERMDVDDWDRTLRRLRVREVCADAKARLYKREV